MNEKVKKILKDLVESIDCSNDIFAYENFYRLATQQICQLFEPKPEGRLLTDAEMQTIRNELVRYINLDKPFGKVEVCKAIAKAQDAKTASIKDAEIKKEKRIRKHVQEELSIALDEYTQLHAECQERVERILDGIKNPHHILCHEIEKLGYHKGSHSPMCRLWNEAIQTVKKALKKKEGVKLQKLDPPPRFDEVYMQGKANMDKPDEENGEEEIDMPYSSSIERKE